MLLLLVSLNDSLCDSRKYPYTTTEGHWKFRGGGGLKGQNIYKGKYGPKLEFPEGWGFKTKRTFCWGSMDIFWNTEHNVTTKSIQHYMYIDRSGKRGRCVKIY